MFLLRILLFPFAVLYDLVTRIRNRLYDLKLKPSAGFDVPVVVVGNLTVGGTGKTPMIEYLIRLLGGGVATLSRGYGRRTRGIRIASAQDTALTLGDEPYQFYTKFGDTVTVAVGEDRALAIPHIVQEVPGTRAVLLDDAFQHRRVTPGFSILLTDYGRPFYKDYLLPAGRLREARAGAGRADVVVVTKCPHGIADEEMDTIARSIRRYTAKPVFFADIRYSPPLPFGGAATLPPSRVMLVTGIADPRPLVKYIETHFSLAHHLKFPDHHIYTADDLKRIKDALPPDTAVFTTEKDKVKLDVPAFAPYLAAMPCFYLPIGIGFVKNGEDFDALVQHAIYGKV